MKVYIRLDLAISRELALDFAVGRILGRVNGNLVRLNATHEDVWRCERMKKQNREEKF